MEKAKEILANIGAIIFGLLIVTGWFYQESYWSMVTDPFWLDKYIFNIIRKINEYIFGLIL